MAKTGYPCIKNNPSLSCRTCPDRCPDVLTENIDAWTIWAAARTQWRTAGMDGAIIGLDYGAMYAVADSLCIEMTPANLTKIQALEHATVKRSREQMKGGK